MQLDEFQEIFVQIENNLDNPRIIKTLEEAHFDLVKLQNAVRSYIVHSENLFRFTEEKALHLVSQKAKTLLNYTENPNFTSTIHNFINNALYLIKNAPKDNAILNNQVPLISEDEFLFRYNKLIHALNDENRSSNLILETLDGKETFMLFKNESNILVIRTSTDSTPMYITKERFVEDAYIRKEVAYPSYEPVIISKIMDNSIFDHIVIQDQFDLKEVLKQGNEIYNIRNELEKLQKNEDQLEAIKENLLEIIEQSKNARNEYLSAKEAAVNDTKLKTSVNYWKNKQSKHQRQFWIYGIISIFLIILLITILSKVISNHNTDVNINEKSINNALKVEVKNTLTLKSDINDNNLSNESTLQNPLDYIHFIGWYALIIFASSSALWVIRIVVKIALSNLHLSEDANERVVMIYTYLAFIEQGQGLEENDKQVILSSLFRPSNIGIIKDESSISVGDIISSLKAK